MSYKKKYLYFIFSIILPIGITFPVPHAFCAQFPNIDNQKHDNIREYKNRDRNESIEENGKVISAKYTKLIFLKNHRTSIDNDQHTVNPIFGNIIKYLPLMGRIILNPNKHVKLSPRYSGLVLNVKKTVGDFVRKGEILAVIEENIGLQQYKLYSPLNGVIITRNLTEGEYVNQDRKAFSVANLKILWAQLSVRQEYFNKIQNNQKIVITSRFNTNGLIKKSYGKIFFVSPIIDEHTMTGEIILSINNDLGNWYPGEDIDGYIPVGKYKASLILPKNAIITVGKKFGVFALLENKIFWKEIVVGRSDQENYQIIKGLKQHHILLLNNHKKLKHILLKKLKGTENQHGH